MEISRTFISDASPSLKDDAKHKKGLQSHRLIPKESIGTPKKNDKGLTSTMQNNKLKMV